MVSETVEILARPATRIVVLTTYASDGEVLRAIEAGAVGYLLKDVPHEELFRALRAVARGERCLAPVVTERLMSRLHRPARIALTERELDVVRPSRLDMGTSRSRRPSASQSRPSRRTSFTSSRSSVWKTESPQRAWRGSSVSSRGISRE
jgi:DNA-binding response OmpR family regulator